MKHNNRSRPRASSRSPVTNRATMFQGGSTGPTVELIRRANGRCRMFWFAFDQDGASSGTMATFVANTWEKARAKGNAALAAAIGDFCPAV